MNGRPLHAQRHVPGSFDGLLERSPEAGPPGAALELCRRGEQIELAPATDEGARSMLPEQAAAEWPFGCILAEHGVLVRCQELPPVRLAVSHFGGLAARWLS